MPSTLEAPAFTAPAVDVGDDVLFNNGEHANVWFPAKVTRVPATGGLEMIVFGHDGGGVAGSDRGGAQVLLEVRDNVRHVDDPDGKTELYRVHTIGDGGGGYWKLSPSEQARRDEIAELRKLVGQRSKQN